MPLDHPKSSTRICFGLYEVDLQSEEIWRAGHRLKLQNQPFKLLVALLERPGEVVTRAELQERLWDKGTIVDFEHSLTAGINKIRELLGDSADNPRFIETLARRGYRFIASVRHPIEELLPREPERSMEQIPAGPRIGPMGEPAPVEGSEAGDLQSAAAAAEDRSPRSSKARVALTCAAALCLLALGWFLPHGSKPVAVERITQLTHEGRLSTAKEFNEFISGSVTDGVHIFSEMMDSGRSIIVSIPVGGGAPVKVEVPDELRNPVLCDISPDGSQLLVQSRVNPEAEQQLWLLTTIGGSAVEVGHVLAHAATWMPNGDILYAAGNGLFTVARAGGNPTLFASLARPAFWLRWDSTGKVLRFTSSDPATHTNSLWQLSLSDRKATPLLSHFEKPVCCGSWTADGSFYVFQAQHGDNSDIWRLSKMDTENPVQVTNGPLQYQFPVPLKTDRSIAFMGVDTHSQLERVTADGKLALERGFLSDATRLEFSRDGQSVLWTEKGRLWKATAEGKQRVQLTADSLGVFLARWSPDGSTIALMAREPNKTWKIYLMPATGGSPQPLLQGLRNVADPSWSADGQSIVFGNTNDALGKEGGVQSLHIVNLSTGAIAPVPGSENLFSPRWSPDGRYIAALSANQRGLRLFDRTDQSWTSIPVSSACDPNWSHDSKAIFVHGCLEPELPINRISLPDLQIKRVTSLSDASAAVDFSFSGLTTEDVPLVHARTSTGNLYSEVVR